MNNRTPYSLEIIAGEAQGKWFALQGDEVTVVGRQADCQVVLAHDPLISRKHARFYLQNGQCFVENLGSLNGVFVNQEQVPERKSLKIGDRIIIGNHLFELKAGREKAALDFASPQARPGTGSGANLPAKGKDILGTAKPSFQDGMRRLSLLAQLMRAAAQSDGLDGLLRVILNLIFQDLRVNRSAIYLYDEANQQWQAACFKIRGENDAQASFSPHNEVVNAAINTSQVGIFQSHQLQGTGLTFALTLPIMGERGIAGFIYLDTPQADFTFQKQDLEFLETLALQATVGLEKSRLAEHVRRDQAILNRVEKHVGEEIMRMVREKKVDLETSDLETQEKEVAILFSDIVGFTSLSERLSPSEIAFILNGYFNHMAECIDRYNGYLNKYIGDAVMAVFGAPFSGQNDSENAIRCAIDMLTKLRQFWNTIDEKKRFKIRIGINTGIVTAGNIGSLNRMEYTVIGDSVNLASRLESKAEPMSILIGENTYQKIKDLFPVRQLGSLQVKGKKEPVEVYQIALAPID